MQRLVAFVLLFAAVWLFAANEGGPPTAFSFLDFMHGEWDIQRSTASLKSGEQSFADVRGHYSIERENATNNLLGRYYENDTATGELSNEFVLYIEFTTPTNGVFKTGASEYNLKTLFAFDFVQPLPDSGNGVILSHGEWFGEKGAASYQFQVGAWDRFTITVIPKALNAEQEVTLYLGKKIPPHIEKTFMQKYGTYIMIGGFFFLQMYLKKKTDTMQMNAARQRGLRAAPKETAATPAAVSTSKKDK